MNIAYINWVLVAVIVVLAVYGIKGYREGLIRTVFGMFSFIIALTAASFIGPHMSKTIKSNEKMIPYLTNKQELGQEELKLPELLKQTLEKNNTEKKWKEYAVKKAEDYIRIQIANWIVNAICFAIIFFGVFLILKYICHVLDLISRLPLINGLNKSSGFLVGILRGFIVLWFWGIVLTIFSATAFGQMIYSYINESKFLSSLYNNNLLFEVGKILL